MRHYFYASRLLGSVGDVVPYPAVELAENTLVLLHHEQPGALLGRDSKVPRSARVEVSVVPAIRGVVGPDPSVTVDLANADDTQALRRDGIRFKSEKTFVESYLRLRTEIIVKTSENDDDLVSGVGGFADEPREVPRLSGLDVTDNQAPPIPPPFPLRVLQEAQHHVRGFVERLYRPVRKAPFEPFAAPLPVSPVPPTRCGEPLDMADGTDQRCVLPDPDAEASDQLIDNTLTVEPLTPLRLHRNDHVDLAFDQDRRNRGPVRLT